MEKDLLILLWMANGFIPHRGEADWYMIGEEIYNCLVWRSFFQVVDGKYKMHDLMHDLARYVMGDDCLVIEPGKEKLITRKEVLHLSSPNYESFFSKKDLKTLTSLRSILIFNAYDYEGSTILDLLYLRVLYMAGIGSLPDTIGKLKYLKYLNFSRSKIEEVPKSIIYLQNLQVLIMEWCKFLSKLPEGMRFMRNLQHLNIKHCDKLEYLPVGILKGVKDVRLTEFPVGKKRGAQIGELGDLNHLVEGELVIKGLENVEGCLREAKNANLKSKTNLLNLSLRWGWRWRWWEDDMERISDDVEEVLEGLEPNPSLKELVIYCYKGKSLSPSWFVNLNNLVKIEFSECRKCENIPALGKLPSLMTIRLIYTESLKCLNDEDYNTSKSRDNNTTTTLFPCLKDLEIHYCSKLVSLPSYFPKLNKLIIDSCESLVSLPDEIQIFKDLNQLTIWYCKELCTRYEKEKGVDWPKISHIPDIEITP